MAHFFGIAPGEERVAEGLRVAVTANGEQVWMHGKWLELGDDHAVVFAEQPVVFIRADGTERLLGTFPAWVVRGKGKRPALAVMTNIAQFRGGSVRIGRRTYDIAA